MNPRPATGPASFAPLSGASSVPATARTAIATGPAGNAPSGSVTAVTLARPANAISAPASAHNSLLWPGAGLLLLTLALAALWPTFRIALLACAAQPSLFTRLPTIYHRAKTARVSLAAAIIMHTESRRSTPPGGRSSPGSEAAAAS